MRVWSWRCCLLSVLVLAACGETDKTLGGGNGSGDNTDGGSDTLPGDSDGTGDNDTLPGGSDGTGDSDNPGDTDPEMPGDTGPNWGGFAGPFTVAEDATTGAVVATLTASDALQLAAITAGNTDDAFAISEDEQSLIVGNNGLNYESKASYTLTIRLRAANDETRDVEITVNVTDVNEAPVLTAGPFVNPAPRVDGNVIGSLSVSDPDAGQTHTFTITAGNEAGVFAIDSASGNVSVANGAASPNESFTLAFQVVDSGVPPLSDTVEVEITLAPPPPAQAPVAADDAAHGVTGVTLTLNILENDTVGDPVGVVTTISGGSVTGEHPADGTEIVFAGGIMTVNASGDVSITAQTPGTFTFNYTLDNGLTSQATVTVTLCAQVALGATVSGRLDQMRNLCITNPDSAVAEYVFIPMNLTANADYPLAVIADNITQVAGNPPTAGSTPITDDHTPLRTAHRTEIAARRGTAGAGQPLDPPASIPAGVPNVGDAWVLNGELTNACSSGHARPSTVRWVSEHFIVVADNENPAGGLNDTQYAEYATNADTQLYGAITGTLGSPPDRDGNGRIVLFFTRTVNELAPPASSSVTLARHLARDLLTQTECPTSNVGEVIYLLVPDPTGSINSNVRTVSSVQGASGTLSHELAHLVMDGGRVNRNAPFEEPWLDESLAGIGAERAFYASSVGLTPLVNIIVTNLTTGPDASRRVAAFNTYANIAFGLLRPWLQSPGRVGFLDSSTNAQSQRGIGWMFLRYLADRASTNLTAENAFLAGVAGSSLTGRANLANALGGDLAPYMRDFLAMVYIDDFLAPASSLPQYASTSWNYRSLYTALNGSYQLALLAFQPGVATNYSLRRGGTASYLAFRVEAGAIATITQPSVPSGSFETWYVLVHRTTIE